VSGAGRPIARIWRGRTPAATAVSSEASHRADIDAGVELARRILNDFGARVTVAKTKGKPAAFIRAGGSIGAVLTMKSVLDCPIAFLDVSLPEHGYHAPNEHFDWEQASGGIAAYAKYFEELA